MNKKGENPQVTLWERLERPAPAPRQTLTPQRIATVAVEIADAHGLDAITMRRLAAELGVAPMAAYRYVSGKDDVLELMVDQVNGEVALPEGAGWRETMRALAVGTRDLALRHPWLAHLPPRTALALTPNRHAVMERLFGTLDGLGLDADAKLVVIKTVDSYAQGTAHAEVAMRELMAGQGWSSGADLRAGLAPQMSWLMSTGRYPAFLRYLREAARKDDLAWQFETGLTYVLDGIATGLGI
ncbi:TetR/AcrR family transcriptional regulator [Sphaerisporangium album]|uniref:TetR/AcrR family transcriptional regulator n=1 Tax=Sphaerisporangium album TaxID=509200 RepID=A0A367FLB6_9ACTN|nr:TetR/AcrR family transcriptional regulator [Sphaerisporangium album]RCG31064.1 TetR/AcrR family transcriptional regulator [Sphaerisporangium album]